MSVPFCMKCHKLISPETTNLYLHCRCETPTRGWLSWHGYASDTAPDWTSAIATAYPQKTEVPQAFREAFTDDELIV